MATKRFLRSSLPTSLLLAVAAVLAVDGFVVLPRQNRHPQTHVRRQSSWLRITPVDEVLQRGEKLRQHRFAIEASTPPSNDEKIFIKESLLQNVLFTKIPEKALDKLVLSFEKVRYETPGTEIVRQGEVCCNGGSVKDDNCYVFLVGEDSKCTVTVDGKVVPRPFGTLREGALFGDLAVLYDEPRAATISVKSKSGATLYRVYGDIYKNIVLSNDVQSSSSTSLELLQQIDDVINQVSGSTSLYAGNIIPPYKPERLWLWRQWSGTILKVSYQLTTLNMVICCLFVIYAHYETTGGGPDDFFSNFGALAVPDESLLFNQRLALIKEIWNYQRDLTTFILAFFLSQAYQFWKDVYQEARDIQGRLNGIALLLVTNTKRTDDGSMTAGSEEFLDDVGRYSRLFHILLWASIAKRFDCLNTRAGLERMASRDLMTKRELEIIQNMDVPGQRWESMPLEWIMIRSNKAVEDGVLASDTSTKTCLLREVTSLRGSFANIEDKLDGRMPLAYVNFVQLLVDTFVLIAPYALYPGLGVYSVIAVGILTLFYTGLLNLAKIFLDPLNNEEFCENSIFMDLGVLIRETNRNSIKWKNAGKQVPF